MKRVVSRQRLGDAARGAEDATADGGADHDRQPEGRAKDAKEAAALIAGVAHPANMTARAAARNPLAHFLPQVPATIRRRSNNGVAAWRHRDIIAAAAPQLP